MSTPKPQQKVKRSRVVIGRKNSRTPIMRTVVNSVVANPPWDIPDDIAARKILPKLRQSPDYLAGKDMVLVDGPADDPIGEPGKSADRGGCGAGHDGLLN